MNLLWFYAALFILSGMTASAAADTTIAGITILTPIVDVTMPPPAPKVQVDIRGPATHLELTWNGPANQFLRQEFDGAWTGKTIFQGTDSSYPVDRYAGGQFAFDLYTKPGKWTLTEAVICSRKNCYGPLGPNLGSFTIKNPNRPDVTAPTIISGVIDTPKLTLAQLHKTGASITLDVKDDNSGIQIVQAVASSDPSCTIPVNDLNFSSLQRLHPWRSGTVTLRASDNGLLGSIPPDYYYVCMLNIADAAGNNSTIFGQAFITNLFGAQPVIRITK